MAIIRPDQTLRNRYQKVVESFSPSCVFGDAQKRQGIMHSSIKPVFSAKICGPALTVKLEPGNLVDCLEALKAAEPGDVIVVDTGGETETSIWGGLMAGLCKQKGVVGAIIDGACRDTDEVKFLNFPLWSKAVVPRATHTITTGNLEPIEINVPIQCGGVVVNPGDIIIADEIGVTVVPHEKAEEVIVEAEKQAAQEEATRKKILEGKSVDELLAEFGRL